MGNGKNGVPKNGVALRCACDRKASYHSMAKSAADTYEVGFECPRCGRQWSETMTAREAHLISGRIQCVLGCGRWHRPSVNVCAKCERRKSGADDEAPCVGISGHAFVPEYEHDCPNAPKKEVRS